MLEHGIKLSEKMLSMLRSPENNHVITTANVDSYAVKDCGEEQMKSLVDKIEATQP